MAQPLRTRHVVAAVMGNALEFYDFITYAFFAVQIGHTFFPADSAYASLMLSLATFGAGFAMRPIGGVVLGLYADRAGRKPAMLLSVALMGFAILAMAVIPSYAAIGLAAPVLVVIARLAQGFALGGEVGSATAFLLEAAPPLQRGYYASWQGASQYAANLAGGLVGFALSGILAPAALDAYGWRIAFALGAAILPFGFLIRRSLPETLHLPEHVPATEDGVWKSEIGLILLGLVVLASGTIFTYVVLYMTTFAQATLHMGAMAAFAATIVIGVCGIAASLFGGWLSDRIGRWPVMVWPRLVNVLICYPVFLWIVTAHSATALLLGTALLSITGILPTGGFYPAFAESLPKSIRGRAFGTVYALSIASFGGTTQLVVAWLIHRTASPLAPAWYVVASGVAGVAAMALMRESAPIRLVRPD